MLLSTRNVTLDKPEGKKWNRFNHLNEILEVHVVFPSALSYFTVIIPVEHET